MNPKNSVHIHRFPFVLYKRFFKAKSIPFNTGLKIGGGGGVHGGGSRGGGDGEAVWRRGGGGDDV